MADYWLTQYALRAAGLGYLAFMLIVISLALWLPKKRINKLIAAGLVCLPLSLPLIQAYREMTEQQSAALAYQQRLKVAQALFAERCKTAGEKIYRTVEGVEGIQLLNLREGDLAANRNNPLWADAALPNEPTGEGYIWTFLLWENYDDKRSSRGYITTNKSQFKGYKFVDVSESNVQIKRYSLIQEERIKISTTLIAKPSRYAVSHINLADDIGRKNWIAGTKILITDTENDEVIAERTSYAFEPGLGSTVGFRQPWGFAVTCPQAFAGSQTRFFVDQILRPFKEK